MRDRSSASLIRLGGPVLALAFILAGAAGCKTAGVTGGGGAGGAGGSSSSGDVGGGAETSGGGGGAAPAGDGGVSTTIPAAFSTLLTNQYLSAKAGDTAVTAGSATAGAAETFTLTDLNGGALADGDEVVLTTAGGGVLSAVNGGGGALEVHAMKPGDDETFVIRRLDGPAIIAPGDHVALKTKLKENYISAIDGGGGEVRADAPWAKAWETFTVFLDGKGPPPSTSGPRQKVLDYLAGVSGNKTVSGQQNKDSGNPSSHTDEIQSITGKTPGFWSADFGFGQYALDQRGTMIAEAKKQWNSGAIVQIMYHNCIPTGDELCGWDDIGGNSPKHLSDDQWSELVTDGTGLNQAWKDRLDKLSVFFADLKAAGVAPLFRPLHEMNQGVFWWGGRGGAEGTRKLFQITHDYLVKTKGFDNIVWVWDIQDFPSLASDVNDYNPGAGYFDVAALDVYDGGYTQQNYDIMLGAASGKPIAIGECATLPTSDELLKQPKWAFFMLWPDFIDQDKGVLPALYNAPNVITLDQMPGWK